MHFVSTRSSGQTADSPIDFKDAVFRGIARDGGLYVPETFENFGPVFSSLSADISFNDLASKTLRALLGKDIGDEQAEMISQAAFSFSPRIVSIAPGMSVLELFHGPSCSFKDFGAGFLAASMNSLLDGESGSRAIILTATSGDTGSAVAQAFHGRKNVDVVILYPSGRVSPLQEMQLTTLGGNVTALEVRGNFDDCQRMVKEAFSDPALAHLNLSSANSINLGRLLPQSFYYLWAWTRLRARGEFCFVVPSGNFGNITAGLYAAAWGMNPVMFFAATNSNKVFPCYLESGRYEPGPSISTYSNAMDVGAPSNFERLYHLYGKDVNVFRRHVRSAWINDPTTLETMLRVNRDYGYLCCPHTAVAWKAAEIFRQDNPEIPCLILATAHPAKFVDVVERATGRKPVLPQKLLALRDRKKHSLPVGNTSGELRQILLDMLLQS